jgi:hypothetical protein
MDVSLVFLIHPTRQNNTASKPNPEYHPKLEPFQKISAQVSLGKLSKPGQPGKLGSLQMRKVYTAHPPRNVVLLQVINQ